MSESFDTITIVLDGQPYSLPVKTTLAALVEQLGHPANAVSTAVNGQFVARAARADCVLQASSQVLLFQPIVGG
jgi:sulfur carrier protein